MRRALCLLTIIMATMTAMAQRGQDFASRFMQQYKEDGSVKCITVSPKMMEQLMAMEGSDRNDSLMQAIAKLKSMRIVQTESDGEPYYQQAETLLKKNAKRFEYVKNFRTERAEGAFYQRKKTDDKVVELVMVGLSKIDNRFVLVNLTGDIDEEFIELLSQMFGQRNTPE